MSKQVVLKSFAELAVALHLEDLPDDLPVSTPAAQTVQRQAGPTVDLGQLLAELEAVGAELEKAARQDEAARTSALQELERYDALVAALQQAQTTHARASQVRAEAEALAKNAFSQEARIAASRAADTARQAETTAAGIVRQRQVEVDEMAGRLDLERLLAERQRQEEAERAQAEAAARQRRVDEVVSTLQNALGEGRLDAATQILRDADREGLENPEIVTLRRQVQQRLMAARTCVAEEALRTARRTYRHDPALAVSILEALDVDGLPEPLARQVFGAWARACLRLCRERGIPSPLRYAPEQGRGAVIAWDEGHSAHVVVSALGMGHDWRTGSCVSADLVRRARPLA